MKSAQIVIDKIQFYYKKKSLYLLLAGILNFCVFILLIWFTAIIVDTFYFDSLSRIFILIAVSSLTLFIFFKIILSPILLYIQFQYFKDFSSITNEIGENFPEIADKLTKRFDFNPSVKSKTLSSGNRQKLGLILALMCEPKVYIFDEPTNSLDPILQNEVYEIINELTNQRNYRYDLAPT